MSVEFEADAVVLDIEGTTSATGFVTEVLYPYSRERLGRLLVERGDESDVRRATDQVRELLGEPEADAARVEQALTGWLDEDRKATPLKTLQGILWSEGFARGELVSHFYDDVVPVLRRWRAAGLRQYVYSSGSVAAQRAWFAHSPNGDLLPLMEGFFDTENAGPKQSADAYRTITAAIAIRPGRTLFLSDRPAELDAARTAGWYTAGVRRPGEPYYDHGTGGHPEVRSFDHITVGSSVGQARPLPETSRGR
ncbi:acireductone synthase [Streptomyces caniferus]|uniref:Enolase-phosphatase E1 n=1 Tax=Streptomyces caniferus TaxID=285557 RepID=A0ABZ1VF02_9ACTN|nr:acireductone synthase [Streptomyces caniferus]